MKKLIALVLMSGMLLSCEHHYREADSGRSGEEIGQFLNTLSTSSNGSSAKLQQVVQLIKDHPEATVYFAEGPGTMGPLHAVTPLDFAYLLKNDQLGMNSFDYVRVYLVDLLTTDGHQDSLVIEYKIKGQAGIDFKVFTDEGLPKGAISGDEFTATLRSDDGVGVVLSSFDLDEESDGEDLDDTIQLEFSELIDGVEGSYLGKVSSLEGFSIFF